MFSYEEVKTTLEETPQKAIGPYWEMFAILRKNQILNQDNIDLITRQLGGSISFLSTILNQLDETHLLDPDSKNLESLLKPPLSQAGMIALHKLYEDKNLSQISFDAVLKFDPVLSGENQFRIIYIPDIFKTFNNTPLNKPENIDLIMNHIDPSSFIFSLEQLKENNLLSQQNFERVQKYPEPVKAGEVLLGLHKLDHEDYFTEVMKSSEPLKIIDAMQLAANANIKQSVEMILHASDSDCAYETLRELTGSNLLNENNEPFIQRYLGSREFLNALRILKKSNMVELNFLGDIMNHPHPDLIILLLKELKKPLDSALFRDILSTRRYSTAELTSELLRRLDQCITDNRTDDYFKHLFKMVEKFEPDDVKHEIDQQLQMETKSHKTELLVIAQFDTQGRNIGFNQEIMDVIRMRQAVCNEKGNSLIVLPYETWQHIMQKTSGPIFGKVNKLSILHHYSENWFYKFKKSEEKNHADVTDYLENIGHYAKRMNGLKDIVLRGCGAAKSNAEHKPLDSEKPHTIEILPPNKDIKSLQPKAHELLLLQKLAEGEIKTFVKYKNSSGKIMLNSISGIKEHAKLEDFSTAELELISSHCENLPLQTRRDFAEHNKQLANRFFSGKDMNPQEIQTVKKSHVRASTQRQESFGDSLAELIRNKLIAAACFGITLKAYVSSYKVMANRVVPSISHDAEKLPKAVKANIRKP